MSVWQSLLNTAAEAYEPRDWRGVLGLLILSASGILTAAGTFVILWRQSGVKKSVDEAKKQLTNGHPPDKPMRGDLETVMEIVTSTHSLVAGHDQDIREMRADIKELKGTS